MSKAPAVGKSEVLDKTISLVITTVEPPVAPVTVLPDVVCI